MPRNPGIWLAVALAALTGCGLLYLAVPRTVAAFLALPGDAVMKKVQAGDPIGAEEARTLALSRHNALAWTPSPSAWSELAYAELWMAYDRRPEAGPSPDPELFKRALRSTERALRGSPTDSEAWMRLAFLRLADGGDAVPAGRALAMAFLTGRVRPKQVAYRLDLAFRLWPVLTADDRRLVMRFLRESWRHGYAQILDAANTPARIGIVRAAFAGDPAILATFEALNARRHKAAP